MYGVMSGNGLHSDYSDNGFQLLNFAVSQNLVIEGTLFDHKEVHKGTWNSLDDNTVNQIDHILIEGCYRSDLQDIRVFRSANSDSDHFLLVAILRARISNSSRNERGTRITR